MKIPSFAILPPLPWPWAAGGRDSFAGRRPAAGTLRRPGLFQTFSTADSRFHAPHIPEREICDDISVTLYIAEETSRHLSQLWSQVHVACMRTVNVVDNLTMGMHTGMHTCFTLNPTTLNPILFEMLSFVKKLNALPEALINHRSFCQTNRQCIGTNYYLQAYKLVI